MSRSMRQEIPNGPKFALGAMVEGDMFQSETGKVGFMHGKVIQLQATFNKLKYFYTIRCDGEVWETPEWRLKLYRPQEVADGWEPKESR